jgi:hypothetical protein
VADLRVSLYPTRGMLVLLDDTPDAEVVASAVG